MIGADTLERNHVNVVGSGSIPLVLAHGFGCDQNMWRLLVPHLPDRFRTVLFDYVGCGQSDPRVFKIGRYQDLKGYAQDIIDVCEDLELRDAILVGHSVSSMTVLMLDIDRFKSLNDTYGHHIGDQVLCALAKIMRATCGDEFVCILSDVDLEQARRLSQRIRQDLGAAVIGGCRFTVSIGVTEIAVSAEMAFSDLLTLTDAALYAAKRLGRNRVHLVQAPAA